MIFARNSRIVSAAAALIGIAAATPAFARGFTVDYGDTTVCTEFNQCNDVCYTDEYGQETCDTVCDTQTVCFPSPHETLPDSDPVCDFNDPDFFHCIGVIQ